MALVSGVGSRLNPDAPLFVPAAYREVEDFSPEWWQLVTTTSWFREYWLSQQQNACYMVTDEEERDMADLLPDSFEFDAFSSSELQFEEEPHFTEANAPNSSSLKLPSSSPPNGVDLEGPRVINAVP